jgi:hypothetical protein
VVLFNAGDYFACHELLEDALWRPAPPGTLKVFYQGLIQVAVGLLHATRENRRGVRNVLGAGLEKLSGVAVLYPAPFGIELLPVLENLQPLHAAALDPATPSPAFAHWVAQHRPVLTFRQLARESSIDTQQF